MASFNHKAAHRLYQILVEPLRPFMHHVRRLVILPDGILTHVPFDALVPSLDKAAARPVYLIQEYEVSYCQFLDQIRPRNAGDAWKTSLLAVANPAMGTESRSRTEGKSAEFSGSLRRALDGDLPDTQDEATMIQKLFGSRSCLVVGKEATKDRVVRLLPRFSVIHLATHCISDENEPDFTGLALGSSERHPMDGVLRLFELRALELDAELAVLNGCNTARGGEKHPAWSPAFAFTVVGARAAIGTLWDIHDRTSRELICNFYAAMRGGQCVSSALRKAKLRAISEGKTDPVLWASHVLIGDPDVRLGSGGPPENPAFLQSLLGQLIVCSCVCACCSVALVFLFPAIDGEGREDNPSS
jgi:CHAT domain-containing protein